MIYPDYNFPTLCSSQFPPPPILFRFSHFLLLTRKQTGVEGIIIKYNIIT